ncbi:tetratricopeptide repeat-containing sensor histidine kinase [Hufsiella ginkgonis]|uniref:histidine kinase n=1 Tax=Hufsiella ginkgonis TaxID=2695274 RepID=A0A7K1XUW8_9SPHI|nr:tetratricopeptide repeat-containing sensor histidine kinase [Hufsiella ginkgonis]MXV14286.1 ATP-binding protein [Hufsiella ginkgonis]
MKSFVILVFAAVLAASCSNNKVGQKNASENVFYTRAIQYKNAGETDSAFLYYDQAKDLFLQAKDSLGVGKCLVNMAYLSIDKGDNFGGQELSLQSLDYLDPARETDLPYVIINFNELGLASYHLKNYSKALEFYDQSLKYDKDTVGTQTVKTNIGVAYMEQGKLREALTVYENILKEQPDTTIFARVLTNYAYTRWLQDSNYNAAPEFQKALRLRILQDDLLGQNASYSHLSDYYVRSRPDSALFYARQMYRTTKLAGNPDDRLEALQKLVSLAPGNQAKNYFAKHQQLNDSLQTARSAAKNQFALVRYESEKHKTENLKLQKENTERRYQVITILLILMGICIGFVSWYRKRKQHMELEKKNAVQEDRLRIYKKVHDVLANGVYRVMAEVEYGNIGKEAWLDKMEVLYEQTRNISYDEKPEVQDIDFHEIIARLITSFAGERTKIAVAGNSEDFWSAVSPVVKHEVEQVLLELMVNMKKHSRAGNVVIRFRQENDTVHIDYADDGVGIPADIKYGNGLSNTGNRIKAIGGEINFDSNKEGLKIRISFPIVKIQNYV